MCAVEEVPISQHMSEADFMTIIRLPFAPPQIETLNYNSNKKQHIKVVVRRDEIGIRQPYRLVIRELLHATLQAPSFPSK